MTNSHADRHINPNILDRAATIHSSGIIAKNNSSVHLPKRVELTANNHVETPNSNLANLISNNVHPPNRPGITVSSHVLTINNNGVPIPKSRARPIHSVAHPPRLCGLLSSYPRAVISVPIPRESTQ